MRTAINRQWLLASRPRDTVAEADFSYCEAPLPAIGDGQFLVRTLYVSLDTELHGWLTGSPVRRTRAIDPCHDATFAGHGRMLTPGAHSPPLPVGAVMRGPALGQVVESRHHGFAAGDFVSGLLGWQQYSASDGVGEFPVSRFEPVHPLPRYLGALGGNGLTAYFGMLHVAQLRAGETVLVSAAAGATGATAAQIAKLKDCRVVGIAGGRDERCWLTEHLELDAAIDHRSEDLDERLGALCPDGVDVCFDNVGGRTLAVVLGHMATWGRIALCGMISGDDDRAPRPGNLAYLITRRIRMEGFLVADHAPRFKEARRQISAWLATGALKSCEHVHEGFEAIPRVFLGRVDGANIGTAMARLGDPA